MALVRSKFIMLNPSCLIKCFLWSLLLILQGCCPFPGSNGSCTKGHYRPKIEKNTTLYNLRMEMIKRDLVEKMGLQEARAKDTPPNHIPDAILKEFWAETERYDAREQTESSRQVKKLMVHAKKVTDPKCPGCIKFSRITNTYYGNISYVDLWIYHKPNGGKNDDKSLIEVYLVQGNSKKLITKRQLYREKHGWQNVALKRISNSIFHEESGKWKIDFQLQLKCIHCTINFDSNMPMVDISKVIKIKKRTRRSLDCTQPDSGCCVDSFKVDFKDILGERANQIILPKSIDVRHCRGFCNEDALSKEHSAILRAAKSKSSSNERGLCCVPQKYRQFSALISINEEIYQKTITDVIVEECGCV